MSGNHSHQHSRTLRFSHITTHYTIHAWTFLLVVCRVRHLQSLENCLKGLHSATHNNNCVIKHYLLPANTSLSALKKKKKKKKTEKKHSPQGSTTPNREVDVTPWPLPKHREVEVRRSELVSAPAPHRVGHVWFGCAPGALISMTRYAVK